jgi:transcriptional regulator of acetoin/glycerol metabolism
LQHTVERMVALRSEGALQVADMPSALHNHLAANGLHRLAERVAEPVRDGADLPEFRHGPTSPVIPLPETEKQEIVKALAATGRQMAKTAQMLGISRTTLYRRMKDYGL